jgi:hypothetical protein
MREVLLPIVRVLGVLLVAAFVVAAAAAGRIYWRASDGLPDHRLAEGAISWQGCIPPDARRVEFVPLNAIPANAINTFLIATEPDFLTREPYKPLNRLLSRAKYHRPSPISLAYVHQLLSALTTRPAT